MSEPRDNACARVVDNESRRTGPDVTLPPDPGSTLPPDPIGTSRELGPNDPASASDDDHVEVLAVGARVGRYIVVERLGAGAMGVVYAAYDPKLDRKVALKLLRPRAGGSGDPARRTARLEREAQAVAKLSHPNVVGIFDVLVHDDSVVLAMEYLGGGTLTQWLAAEKRRWRDVVRMFIEVGHGLAAAHAEGQIHRDFKPDNVLLDKNGVPKVVDFGLVRMTSVTTSHLTVEDDDDDQHGAEGEVAAVSGSASLTRTGAISGTPAYMSPEQFLGKRVDGRTDQFAFCVALYEALYGERPFPGDTVIALADSVTGGRMRALVKKTDIPAWVRACVVRGLKVSPDERFAELDALVAALTNDPIARRNRRMLSAAAVVMLVGGVLTTRHFVLQKRHEIERQAAEQIAVADTALVEARAKRAEAKALRDRAMAAFDGYQRDKGEDLWALSAAAGKTAGTGYQRSIQRLEAAVTLTPRRDLKDRIADVLVEMIETDGHTEIERDAMLRRLALFDDGGVRAARLNAPAKLRIETSPPGLVARIESYDSLTRRLAEPARPAGRTPIDLKLAPGSYRLTFEETATHVGFNYPVLLAAGESHRLSVPVPARTTVPKDFVYVPEGSFLFGSANEELRTTFLGTVPLHSVPTTAFLIARHETTVRDWIAFLETLTPGQKELRRPRGRKDIRGGFVEVRQTSDAGWEILFRVTDRTYRAGQGELIRYAQRTRRVSQDWMMFPVTGISAEDARQYVRWLDASGRVSGARLCTEHEWEKAARGVDGREFPHGDSLSFDDANFDLTYARQSGAFGPDETGSHPASQSPFSVDDLAGNAWDIAVSVLDRESFVIRGGSFYQGMPSLRTSNRDPISAVTRDPTVGFRVCASARL